VKIICGDSLTELKKMESESVDCVITSPPYWALRDYGIEGQLGLEPTFQEYITKLCDIFDEVKRVLKNEGTCWVNLGDTYGSGKGEEGDKKKIHSLEHKRGVEGFQKCLLQIPSRFAIEMCNRGWILRNVIIWHKPNCMPSSVKDRFTVDFEYVFFFVKNKKYWFEPQYEPQSETSGFAKQRAQGIDTWKYGATEEAKKAKAFGHSFSKFPISNPQGRNKRCVWTITTKPFKEAHFATFPEALVEPMIKAGCPEFVCKKCGKAREKILKHNQLQEEGTANIISEKQPYSIQKRKGLVAVRELPNPEKFSYFINEHRKKVNLTIDEVEEIFDNQAPHHWFNGESFPSKEDYIKLKKLLEIPNNKYDIQMIKEYYKPAEKMSFDYKTIGYTDCGCNAGFDGGVVLDPFSGAGTTGVVAKKLGRHFIGIDLNPEYIKMAQKRIDNTQGSIF